jgi:hypothetical protein
MNDILSDADYAAIEGVRPAGWAGRAPTQAPGAAAHVDESLDALPAKYQDAVVLRCVVGLSEAETAEALGCPWSAANRRVLRGLERMQKFLSRRGFAMAPEAVAGLFVQTREVLPFGLASRITACCTGKAVVSTTVLTTLQRVEGII